MFIGSWAAERGEGCVFATFPRIFCDVVCGSRAGPGGSSAATCREEVAATRDMHGPQTPGLGLLLMLACSCTC